MKPGEFIEKVVPANSKLYRFAFRMLANKEEAEDIVQETFLRLWTKRMQLNSYKSIDALAMIITKNLCIDLLKSRKKFIMNDDENISDLELSSPYNKTELEDSVMNVNKIINQLPEQQKMIIQLRDIEGYSFEEIEKILEININTIRVNLSRARKKVRDTLAKQYDYELNRN